MRSLSVIILAYNVGEGLRSAYRSSVQALGQAGILDSQMIIVTSESSDGTIEIADAIARENPGIVRVHGRYANRAEAFLQGLKMADRDFVTWVPGDNVIIEGSLADIFGQVGKADLVIGYTVNGHIRPLSRRLLSWCMVSGCNLLFGLNVQYYSGVCIFPRHRLQSLNLSPDAIGFMVEAVVRLLKSGATHIHVPQKIRPTAGSSIGNSRSMLSGTRTILKIFLRYRTGF